MGCGCGGSHMASVSKNRVEATTASVTPKTVNTAVCIQKYDELAELDKKVISLHQKFRLVANTGKRYAEIQRVLRSWIRNLTVQCPDEDELSSYKEFVNGEYAKYCK